MLTGEATRRTANHSASTGHPSAMHWDVVVLLAVVFAAYAPTVGYEFVGDDRYQIVGNPHVQSWHFVGRYFTQHHWSHVDREVPGDYYRPVFLLWLRINHALFGLEPWKWHLAVVVVHMLVTWMLYLLVRRITQDEWSAGIAAMIFGLHPVHIESVAWVSGIPDPLAAVFLLGSFLCYLRQRERRDRGATWRAASWALYALALLTKEISVSLPFIVVAYEWILGTSANDLPRPSLVRQRAREAIARAVPYLALTAIFLGVRAVVLRGRAYGTLAMPLSTALWTLPSLVCFYIKHLVWPAGLNGMYDVSYVTRPDFTNFVLPALAVALVAVVLGWWARRSQGVAFAALWLVLPLLPVLDVRLLTKDNFAHDRFAYIPSVGFSMMVGLAWGALKTGRSRRFRGLELRLVPVLVVGALLIAGTVTQSVHWKNELLFTEHELSGTPPSGALDFKNNVGIALAERGRLLEAMDRWHAILNQDPNFYPAAYNLGYFSYKAGRLDEAERYLLRALEIKPSDPPALLCLGLTWFKMSHLKDAETALRRSIALRPDGYGYHFALGYVLKTEGDLPGAVREFQTELSNYPQHELAREQIGETQMTLRILPRGRGPASDSRPAYPSPPQ